MFLLLLLLLLLGMCEKDNNEVGWQTPHVFLCEDKHVVYPQLISHILLLLLPIHTGSQCEFIHKQKIVANKHKNPPENLEADLISQTVF